MQIYLTNHTIKDKLVPCPPAPTYDELDGPYDLIKITFRKETRRYSFLLYGAPRHINLIGRIFSHRSCKAPFKIVHRTNNIKSRFVDELTGELRIKYVYGSVKIKVLNFKDFICEPKH